MSDTPRTLRTGGFDELFAVGAEVRTPNVEATVEVVELGTLALPSGRLAACDPMVFWELDPFTVALPPGDHPVVLSVARIGAVNGRPHDGDRPHRRVAAAMVRFSGAPARRWELAVIAGQDPATLTGDMYFGYGVDAATGAFVDASGEKALDRLHNGEYDLAAALTDAAAEEPPSMGANMTDPETGINVVAFPSGWGDGVYPTWVGRGEDGAPVSVVTDFHVL